MAKAEVLPALELNPMALESGPIYSSATCSGTGGGALSDGSTTEQLEGSESSQGCVTPGSSFNLPLSAEMFTIGKRETSSEEPACGPRDILRLLPKPGADWELTSRYQWRRLIGTGSYGSVCEAVDLGAGPAGAESECGADPPRMVAIKRIYSVFANVHDGKRVLRELAILRRLRGLPASRRIVPLLDVLPPNDPSTFSDLYLVLEHAGQDLRQLSRRRCVNLSEGRIRALMRSLLRGLGELHSYGIYHRDLKPANCLVPFVPEGAPDSAWEIRICDFGHARICPCQAADTGSSPGFQIASGASSTLFGDGDGDSDPEEPCYGSRGRMTRSLTCHVATRWYRAPELILLQRTYTAAVDVWSAGCILAELLGMLPDNSVRHRGPLLPGRACFPLSPTLAPAECSPTSAGDDQLALIVALLGSPSEDEVAEVCGGCPGDVVAEAAKRYLRSFKRRPPLDLSARFASAPPAAVELLRAMLQFSPSRRATVRRALSHPFLTNGTDEPAVEPPVATVQLEPLAFEDAELGQEQLRALVLEEIRLARAELRWPDERDAV